MCLACPSPASLKGGGIWTRWGLWGVYKSLEASSSEETNNDFWECKLILTKASRWISLATWFSAKCTWVTVTLSAVRSSQTPTRFWLPHLELLAYNSMDQINIFFLQEPSLGYVIIALKHGLRQSSEVRAQNQCQHHQGTKQKCTFFRPLWDTLS